MKSLAILPRKEKKIVHVSYAYKNKSFSLLSHFFFFKCAQQVIANNK